LLERVLRNPDTLNEEVANAMDPPLRAVEMGETVDTVFSDLEAGNTAVIVATRGKPVGVLTRADLLEYLANNQARDGT
jgi:cystathionine beta-synthase